MRGLHTASKIHKKKFIFMNFTCSNGYIQPHYMVHPIFRKEFHNKQFFIVGIAPNSIMKTKTKKKQDLSGEYKAEYLANPKTRISKDDYHYGTTKSLHAIAVRFTEARRWSRRNLGFRSSKSMAIHSKSFRPVYLATASDL